VERAVYNPSMSLRAVLFDYGGTLDAPGVPWVERFLQLYREAGWGESKERIRAAFGHATRCAYNDTQVSGFSLEETVAFHVERQREYLGRPDAKLSTEVADRFVRLARADLQTSRETLERLQPRVALGVISNFYGNVHLLLEAGIAPLLSVILDSTRVGISKPDPAIFNLALERIGCAATEAVYVGDSFEKDVVGAHAAGVHTAWLVGSSDRACPDPGLVELRLRELAELESLLTGGCFA
jgi:putative hydrolase of the HAD superfamily